MPLPWVGDILLLDCMVILTNVGCRNKLLWAGWLTTDKGHSSGGSMSKVKVPTDLVSGEGPFLGS